MIDIKTFKFYQNIYKISSKDLPKPINSHTCTIIFTPSVNKA